MVYEPVLPHRLDRAAPDVWVGYPDNTYPTRNCLLANVEEHLANNGIFKAFVINAEERYCELVPVHPGDEDRYRFTARIPQDYRIDALPLC